MRCKAILFVPVLSLGACRVPHTSVDTSQLCFSLPANEDGDDIVELQADEPLTLSVYAGGGCHTDDRRASCELAVDGETITATTLYEWVRTEPFATNCESIFYMTYGTCSTPPLAAGTYTLEYADDSVAFDVPGEASGCLDGL